MDINPKAPVTASAEIVIDAPIEHVWQMLTDLEHWPRWNPDVRDVEFHGPLAVGAEFRLKAGGSPVYSTLQDMQRLSRLAWTGKTLGISTVHVWEFEATNAGTRVRTRESFEGLLARLLRRTLNMLLSRSLNQSLVRFKHVCEQQYTGSSTLTPAVG